MLIAIIKKTRPAARNSVRPGRPHVVLILAARLRCGESHNRSVSPDLLFHEAVCRAGPGQGPSRVCTTPGVQYIRLRIENISPGEVIVASREARCFRQTENWQAEEEIGREYRK